MALHIKTIRGKQYVYDVKSVRDKETKKVKKITTYMGPCTNPETKEYSPKRSKFVSSEDKVVLNYGDTKIVSESLNNSRLAPLFREILPEEQDTLNALVGFTVIENSASKNSKTWFAGNVASVLYPNAKLESQRVSETITKLGDEKLQRRFFEQYLSQIAEISGEIAIDSTGFPNEIKVPLTVFGSHGGDVQKEMRQIMVVDRVTHMPLYFRLVAGNIADVSTLITTFKLMTKLGATPKMVIMDAGYYSEKNIRSLCSQKIDFLTRLPCGRKLYSSLISQTESTLLRAGNRVVYNKRALFIQKVQTEICGYNGFAYVCCDVKQRGLKLDKFLRDAAGDKLSDDEINAKMASIGVFVLVSNRDIGVLELLPLYYTRQLSEETFGFEKSVLNMLPLRVHKPETVRGYSFLCFLALLLSIEIQQKLSGLCSLRDALNLGHNHLCEIWGGEVVPFEPNRQMNDIYTRLGFVEVNSTG